MADDRENFDIIKDALQQYGGMQKIAGSWHMVRCPFHDDVDPSCGVFIEIEGKRDLGSINCLGCGAHGSWNEFAAKAGLPTIKEWANNANGVVGQVITADIENDLLGDSGLTFKEVLNRMNCKEAQRWPPSLEWRGFSGQLIHDVGGHIIADNYNDSIAVLFPIKIAGKVRGGVKAIFEKKDGEKNKLGYLTMRGEWIKSYGLFPYVYVKNLLRRTRYNFLVIVEGPRDALRLVANGIPALALLGARTTGRVKIMFLMSLGIRTIYVMPDSDNGGNVTWESVKAVIDRTKVDLKRIRIPEGKDGRKRDPGNMPARYIHKLADLLEEHHGFDPSTLIE